MDQILHRKLINEKTNLEFQVAKANKEVAKLMETVKQYEAVLASLDDKEEVKEGTERISTPNREFYPASKKTQARREFEDTKKPGEIWPTPSGKFGGKNQHNQVSYFKDETKAKAWTSGKTKYKKIPYFKDDPYIDESIIGRILKP